VPPSLSSLKMLPARRNFFTGLPPKSTIDFAVTEDDVLMCLLSDQVAKEKHC